MNRDPLRSEPIALVTFHAGFHHSSLALRTLKAFCRDEPFYDQIQLFETTTKTSMQPLLEQLYALRPTLVGFSTYLWNIHESLQLARLLKQLLPKLKILFGGPEAGPRGEELLQRYPFIDWVIYGEGEGPFRDLCRQQLGKAPAEQNIGGLVWRDRGLIRRNPEQNLPVEKLVSPFSLQLMDNSKPLIYWETSRGCPYTCTFCSSATDKLRAFPLPQVEADLAWLACQENKIVKLLDRSFHLGAKRTESLLQQFAATPEGLCFHLELNPDNISEGAFEIFAAAKPGKFQFEIGLQTLDVPVLERIERRMNVPKALVNIERLVALKKHHLHLDLIAGLPGESAEQFLSALDRTFALAPHHLQLGILKILPGTPLHAQAAGFGYEWDREPPYEMLFNPDLEFAEMARIKRYAELLERLWNSELLLGSISRLLELRFEGRISQLFESLLSGETAQLAEDRIAPEWVFALLAEAWHDDLQQDQLLRQLFVWDFVCAARPSRKMPTILQHALAEQVSVETPFGKRQLPKIVLGEAAVEIINRFRLESLEAGEYAVGSERHLKGRPLNVVRLVS